MYTLTIIAGVLAVSSLLFTALFVHDRRYRTPGLLLNTGLICNIVNPFIRNEAIRIALIVISAVLAVASLVLFRRVRRAAQSELASLKRSRLSSSR